MSGITRLEDVVQDDRFVEVDLLLRRGHHLGREDHDLYTFVLDALEPLEGLYERYGARLIHRTDGCFFLVPSGDRLSRRQLSAGEMLVGQALALAWHTWSRASHLAWRSISPSPGTERSGSAHADRSSATSRGSASPTRFCLAHPHRWHATTRFIEVEYRIRLTVGHVLRHAPASSAAGADAAYIDIAQDLFLRKLSDDGVLDMVAFKGGTAHRKVFAGASGRFSTDLDFSVTNLSETAAAVQALMSNAVHGAIIGPFH